jgi:hypothetical protein
VNATGLPPLHSPGTAVSRVPVRAVPRIVGGDDEAGAPAGKGASANGDGSGAFARSASLQCAIPGIVSQFVHCQKLQLRPLQPDAGTSGEADFVQCATHSPLPFSANCVVSPSRVFQKFGEA